MACTNAGKDCGLTRLKRAYCGSVASGRLTTLTMSLFLKSILFCDFEGLKSELDILADIQALQLEQEGLYKTFCDLLNPCFDRELLRRLELLPYSAVNSFLST